MIGKSHPTVSIDRPRRRVGASALSVLPLPGPLGVSSLRAVVATSCVLAFVPDTVAAHGVATNSGYAAGVAVAVAVALGLVVGLLGVLLGCRRTERTASTAFGTAVALGFILLGLAFILPAVSNSPAVALGGIVVGGGLTKLGVRVTGPRADCPCLRSTDFAVGSVAVHRVVEGIALGGAISVGGHVGLLGIGVVAGHTAVEAGLLGAAYASTSSLRGVAAVGGIQLALVGGVAAGLTALAAIPPLVETTILALAGSALIVAGVETARARPVLSA